MRQFGIDIDTRILVKLLLQRVHDNVLALLDVAGGTRRLGFAGS